MSVYERDQMWIIPGNGPHPLWDLRPRDNTMQHVTDRRHTAFCARTDRKGIVGNGEHERSRQEKEARAGWVIRQIQIGVAV